MDNYTMDELILAFALKFENNALEILQRLYWIIERWIVLSNRRRATRPFLCYKKSKIVDKIKKVFYNQNIKIIIVIN